MNVEQYAPLARRTLKELSFRPHMIHMALGIAGEFGELIDAAKKIAIYGKEPDRVNLMEEAGDTLWYVVNLLIELQVEPWRMQRSMERGFAAGQKAAASIYTPFDLAEGLLQINKVVAEQCALLPSLHETDAAGTGYVITMIEQLAGNVGVVCGIIGIDMGEAMQRNIEKLAKRYGDKFSEFAALNRDVAAERTVLEGNGGAEPSSGSFTFDQFLEYGRGWCVARNTTFLDNMPWSFTFYDTPVTHETDNEYIVGDVRFKRGQTIHVVDGRVCGVAGDAQ